MTRSTLCYLRNKGRTLMMLRNKKHGDVNSGKWIGVGGKFESGESAEMCLRREVREETGIEPDNFVFHGIIDFISDTAEDEEMYLYSAEISSEMAEAVTLNAEDEGTLRFIPDDEIMSLPLWEGDRVFLDELLSGRKRISYEFTYKKDRLVKSRKILIRNILFDLDGTLIDTGEGIMRSAQYALESIGIEVSDYRELSFFVGPPLVHTYTQRYGLDMDTARRLVTKYRERYNDIGLFECEPYKGVIECVQDLRDKGYRTFVASSKPEAMCKRLLMHFDMLKLFDDVAGATPDGKIDTKSEVLYELFGRYPADTPGFAASSILIGDTRFDIAGANDVGISSLGVSYGYGSAEELSSLGAASIVSDISEITDSLIQGL
ncbi:MAG: HAD hydrolase-like protein [Lachnospiraceae bacterium]|nr:HAD hydrolase-like protein [Lachnospiraceae bacterium]